MAQSEINDEFNPEYMIFNTNAYALVPWERFYGIVNQFMKCRCEMCQASEKDWQEKWSNKNLYFVCLLNPRGLANSVRFDILGSFDTTYTYEFTLNLVLIEQYSSIYHANYKPFENADFEFFDENRTLISLKEFRYSLPQSKNNSQYLLINLKERSPAKNLGFKLDVTSTKTKRSKQYFFFLHELKPLIEHRDEIEILKNLMSTNPFDSSDVYCHHLLINYGNILSGFKSIH